MHNDLHYDDLKRLVFFSVNTIFKSIFNFVFLYIYSAKCLFINKCSVINLWGYNL